MCKRSAAGPESRACWAVRSKDGCGTQLEAQPGLVREVSSTVPGSLDLLQRK